MGFVLLFRVTSRCIIINGDKILVQLSRKGDFYRLPGGRIRADETLLQGLERELREELGIVKVDSAELYFVVESFYKRRSGIVHEIGFYFLCNPGSETRFIPKEDHLKIGWVNISSLSSENFRPAVLASYLKKLQNGQNCPKPPIYLVNIDIEE